MFEKSELDRAMLDIKLMAGFTQLEKETVEEEPAPPQVLIFLKTVHNYKIPYLRYQYKLVY
jgi:hypothetical protein